MGSYIGPGYRKSSSVSTVRKREIDKLPNPAPAPKPDVWKFFKLLRSYGLQNDQVGILVRKFCYGQSRAQIMREMGWVSNHTFDRRYQRALDVLKQRGYGQEE